MKLSFRILGCSIALAFLAMPASDLVAQDAPTGTGSVDFTYARLTGEVCGVTINGTALNDRVRIYDRPGDAWVIRINGIEYDVPVFLDCFLIFRGGDGDDSFVNLSLQQHYYECDVDGGPGDDFLASYANFTVEPITSSSQVPAFGGYSGGDGDDFIISLAAVTDVLLMGGNGNDRLVGRNATFFSGGSGDDDMRGGGSVRATFNGHDGNDYIVGGSGNDVVRAGAGRDIVYGGAGDDFIDTGGTNDVADLVFGGSGNDEILGGSGSDQLWGGPGNDTIFGEIGSDAINGGSGDDILHGGGGHDVISGTSGDDIITGGNGDDRLYGNTGIDTIDGGQGNNIVRQ